MYLLNIQSQAPAPDEGLVQREYRTEADEFNVDRWIANDRDHIEKIMAKDDYPTVYVPFELRLEPLTSDGISLVIVTVQKRGGDRYAIAFTDAVMWIMTEAGETVGRIET